MSSEPLPVLRCESRRPPAFERGFLLWSLALVLVGAAALDAFWAVPRAQRAALRSQRQVEMMRCRQDQARERKVEDVQLLTPTQAVR
jgi:hypothetical protein